MDANKIIAGAADHDDRGYRPKQDYWHFPLLRFNGGTTRRTTGCSRYRENVAWRNRHRHLVSKLELVD